MPRRKKDFAKNTNVQAFGRASDETETSGDYANYNKMLPKKHTDMRRVTAHLNAIIEKLEDERLPGVSLAHIKTMGKLYEVAMRDNFEDMRNMRCPSCRKVHVIAEVECEHCGDVHPVTVPSAAREKNSIACLLKLSDKFFANLAAVSQEVNVNLLSTNLTEFLAKNIIKYVPETERPRVIRELDNVLNNVIDAEYSEVTNG